MKKLYKKGTVYPSPQIKSDNQLLSLLPVAIYSLAAVLSPQDREVLAYLISTASYSGERNFTSRVNKTKPRIVSHSDNHSPLFHCDCFSCYTSYWVRWDSSPSRQLIHEIIDAFEDSLEKKKQRKGRENQEEVGVEWKSWTYACRTRTQQLGSRLPPLQRPAAPPAPTLPPLLQPLPLPPLQRRKTTPSRLPNKLVILEFINSV